VDEGEAGEVEAVGDGSRERMDDWKGGDRHAVRLVHDVVSEKSNSLTESSKHPAVFVYGLAGRSPTGTRTSSAPPITTTLQPPEPTEQPGRSSSDSEINRRERFGGLIHEYHRTAA
jgi:hypothetical protein